MKKRKVLVSLMLLALLCSCKSNLVIDSVELTAILLREDDGTGFVDLDKKTGTLSALGDLRLTTDYGSGEFLSIDFANGVVGLYAGEVDPGVDGCKDLENAFLNASVFEVSPGGYICVLTDEGNFSVVRIDEVIPDVLDKVKITYRTLPE